MNMNTSQGRRGEELQKNDANRETKGNASVLYAIKGNSFHGKQIAIRQGCSDDAGLGGRVLQHIEPDRTRQNQIEPDRTRQNQAEPDRTR